MDQAIWNKWDQVLELLKEELAENAIRHWLKAPCTPLELSGGTLTIGVIGDLYKDKIESNYRSLLEEACSKIFGKVKLEIIVSDKAAKRADIATPSGSTSGQNNAASGEKASGDKAGGTNAVAGENRGNENAATGDNGQHELNFQAQTSDADDMLDPRYTFETLLNADYNKLAYAVAEAVADNPGHAYNPFFIYGGVGLGKTHLMKAIGYRVKERNPEAKVLYITSERFTYELIESIRDNSMEKFRAKYRTIDVLLVDDIQFLDSKIGTQEEFFHTFNSLKDHDKAIVLTSDRPPRDMTKLQDRLRSRFEGGIVTDIQPPNLETRVAILKLKAKNEKIAIPDTALTYIANIVDSNVRELEGALSTVKAHASFFKQEITLDFVKDALSNLANNSPKKEVKVELIQEVVARDFQVSVDDLLGKARTRAVAMPRQIAMYLARELTSNSLPQIGTLFNRDHSTVVHACDKITEDIETNQSLKATVERLTEEIKAL